MAHECPECYCLCHCGGDIDDCDFGESEECTHYKELECSGHREYCDDQNCRCRARRDREAAEDYDEEIE